MLISSNSSTASTSTGNVTKTDTTYKDDNMEIEITTGKASDSTYYVADIKLSSADYLKQLWTKHLWYQYNWRHFKYCPAT